MSRDLRRLFELIASDPAAGGPWRPPADVYRTRGGWLIKLDLAGVRPEDVEVRCRGQALAVTGVRRDATVSECQRSYSMEIVYSRFQRTFELPEDLSCARMAVDYRDGMLLVRLNSEEAER